MIGSCGNCGERIETEKLFGIKCPECKATKKGPHWVWEVTPDAEGREAAREDSAVAYECAVCGLKSQGGGRSVGSVIRERECPPEVHDG
jgi:predicted RNA-binding Zn-ribbon protein involved in translation (DUF1610 family)